MRAIGALIEAAPADVIGGDGAVTQKQHGGDHSRAYVCRHHTYLAAIGLSKGQRQFSGQGAVTPRLLLGAVCVQQPSMRGGIKCAVVQRQ